MSGITPLLDTLLHQVLGKRIDTAPPRDLNEPVRAVDPGEGPRALHSDSRLDGRRPAAAPLSGTTTPSQRGDTPAGQTDTARSPASIQTHFSPSARTIADLLVRFPAPPSVLTATSPLMALDEAPSASTLASRLQAGVRDSGLFYESHLSRWYRGEVSRQQLEREPQMWRTLRFSPASTAPGAAAPDPRAAPGATGAGSLTAAAAPGSLAPPLAAGSGTLQGQAAQAGTYSTTAGLLPGSAGGGQGAGAQATAQGGGAAESSAASLRDTPAPGRGAASPQQAAGDAGAAVREQGEGLSRARPAGGEAIHESLQGLVRHQLEMLVTPMLRWEGDVWSGIFMALMVQLPAGAKREGEGEQGDDGQSEQDTWHSELQLRVPSLGDIRVAMWLRDTDVRLELKTHDEGTLVTLQRGVVRLEERLKAAGMSTVLIDVRHLGEEGPSDGERT
ncbi:flagellar hook-length control protein FliK [Halomonas sp. ANAO-440]|uniref:flagellar hook-length control protein FliK n=1 Tax=Halomonas sp. ANAO-440 TaxID=2861360 RepID=UPI001CAA55C9|nr:flagellar hook-length control protein FliK [Halomonas sp. ANAO-440]MBZ0331733.1 flagellar hook-length control protein FliK [Halomonas sp. ANAO-440]